MAVIGTWNVIVTRRDGSQYFGTVFRGNAPQLGEVVAVKAAGRQLQARIDALIHFLPCATGPGIWRLGATETLVEDAEKSRDESQMVHGLLLTALRRQLLGTVSHRLGIRYAG
jgi:hypothetical protein